MKKPILTLFAIFFLNVIVLAQDHDHNHDHVVQNIEFVENNNQWHENVLYKADVVGGIVYLEENSFTYNFISVEDQSQIHDMYRASEEEQDNFMIDAHAWKFEFIGASQSELIPAEKQSHYYNYFLGSDESKWVGNVGVFSSVGYENVYSGIDLKTYSHGGNFKYDWVLSPNADPSQIKVSITGIENPAVVGGKLLLPTSIGDFYESEPYAYQKINGELIEVECSYLLEDNVLSFYFPNGYDTSEELVIDPELIAATLSGTTGSSSNYGHTATFDIEGNIYTGCISFNSAYPVTTGAYSMSFNGGGTDCGISKLSADGSDLIWASFLGGNGEDHPHSMICNGSQELYVYGSTSSSDFSVTSSAYQNSSGGSGDIFISHFSADGASLIGSTYMGGSENDGSNMMSVNYGDTYRGEIILDFNEKPLVTSCSSSNNFPTSGGAYQSSNEGMQDAVVFRLNPALSSLEMSTFIGGTQNDNGYGVKVTEDGSIYVAGGANVDFPTTAGVYQNTFGGDSNSDGFISKLNSSGTTLLASTYLGTSSADQIFFLELDSEENIFVFGQGGTDMPVVGAVYVNPNSAQFVTKLNPDLTEILVSSTIGTGGGGWGFDFVPDAFLVDNCDNIYLSGYSASGDLALTDDALYTDGGFYLAVFTPNIESLEYGTLYSGNHVDGGTSRFDKNGTVYQAVCSGGGFSTTTDAYATDQSPSWDVGVFKINFDVSGVNASISGADINGCAPFETTFENFSNGDQFVWDFGDGTTSVEYEPSHVYTDPGVYTVSLIVTDSLSCNIADTSSFDIIISTPIEYTPDFEVELGCNDLSVNCINNTGIDFLQYLWDFGDGTVVEAYDADHFYDVEGLYTIQLTAIDNGCNDLDTLDIVVNVLGEITAVIGNDSLLGCAPYLAEFENLSAGSVFTWDFGDGSEEVVGSSVSYNYTAPGTYTVSLLVEGLGNCDGMDSTTTEVIVIQPLAGSNFILDEIPGCEEILIQTNNLSEGIDLTYLWEFGDGATSIEENPEHLLDSIGTFTVMLTVFDNVCDQSYTSEQNVTIPFALDYQIEDTHLCYDMPSTMVNANNNEHIVEYLWSSGETTEEISISQIGNYSISVLLNNCWIEDEFKVLPVHEMDLDSPLEICEGNQMLISVPYSDGSNFIWNTQETNSYISVDEPGDYSFSFSDYYGCHQAGIYTVDFTSSEAILFIPNAFTPNGDGINDFFYTVTDNLDSYKIVIWNRWGDIIYRSVDPNAVWSGDVNEGVKLSSGENVTTEYYAGNETYTYRIEYSSFCNSEKEMITGKIIVIR